MAKRSVEGRESEGGIGRTMGARYGTGASVSRRTVAIAGAGLVGRTLALALASHTRLEPVLYGAGPPPEDRRASAVSAAGRTLFERIGVWPLIEEAAQPITEMVITDSAAEDTVRRPALSFHDENAHDAFAFMVENGALHDALARLCAERSIATHAARITWYDEEPAAVSLEAEEGPRHTAAIVVAADGRRSKLRDMGGIGVVEKAYRQVGVVGTVSHSLPHHGQATQHFLPNGPFAMLPLKGDQSSIVWTEHQDAAGALLAMDPMIASLEIERVFGLSLGRLCVEGQLQGHPLSAMLARTYASGRMALIGDAAHVIHPLAGQGLNLGLKDVAVLTESLREADRNGEDLQTALPRYARERRPDALRMAFVTDSLNTLFSRRSDLLRSGRSIGLELVDNSARLKAAFIDEASGRGGAIPSLMR